jgi:aspartate/methionine/tyrosine aminotransferase
LDRTYVAHRSLSIPDSATVAIADAVTEQRRAGVDVVDFSAGRAAEHTPDFIVEAASRAMAAGDTHQTMAKGRLEFREACAAKLARDNHLEYDPETEIIITLGCKQGLFLALLATLDPGDEVLVEDPGFVSYEPAVRYCGGEPVAVALLPENRFRWTRTALAERVSDRTKAIILCSPHNPSGVVHDVRDLQVIAELARERNLLVYSDETYERLTWSGREHVPIASLPGMKERTVTLMGLTKSFSMGGWRVGFAATAAPIVAAMTKVQQHLVTCPSSFAQTGAQAAFEKEAPENVTSIWADWEKRCHHATSALDELPGVRCAPPEGGFYAWADVSALATPVAELATDWLTNHRVAVVPGSAFGPSGEGYVRITCVRSWRELEIGLERLRRALG